MPRALSKTTAPCPNAPAATPEKMKVKRVFFRIFELPNYVKEQFPDGLI
jgi:hypothetical protein